MPVQLIVPMSALPVPSFPTKDTTTTMAWGYSLLGRHLRISPDSYQLELLVTAALDLPFDAKC